MEPLSKLIKFESIEVKIGRFGSRSRTEFTFRLVNLIIWSNRTNLVPFKFKHKDFMIFNNVKVKAWLNDLKVGNEKYSNYVVKE